MRLRRGTAQRHTGRAIPFTESGCKFATAAPQPQHNVRCEKGGVVRLDPSLVVRQGTIVDGTAPPFVAER